MYRTGHTGDSRSIRFVKEPLESPMQNSSQQLGKQRERPSVVEGKAMARSPLLRIGVIHSDTAVVDRCVAELKHARMRIEAEIALTAAQVRKAIRAKHYDVILAQYPPANARQTRTIKALRENGTHTPLIFVTRTLPLETAASLIRKGAADCVQVDNLSHLPVVIRRVLSDERLRAPRGRAEQKLRHSEAHYRALVGNLSYGICRCTLKGKLLDANEALVAMLGCQTKEELMAWGFTTEIACDPFKRQQ